MLQTRPLTPGDLPALAELLSWMDEDPARRVLAPEGRSPEILAEELEGGWVLEDEGEVLGYAGLVPFWRGAAIEGPVARVHPGPLIAAAERAARDRGITTLYAFPAEANEGLITALEAAGFGPVHTTHFFATPPRELGFAPPEGVRIEEVRDLDPQTYRHLYRESDEGWSLRLTWSDEELMEHFALPENRLFFAYEGAEPVGLVELELDPDGAEVAYIGVVPRARGRGIGQALLATALRAARGAGVPLVRVRAHDHEKEALRLYRRLGFTPIESVVTYAKELDQRTEEQRAAAPALDKRAGRLPRLRRRPPAVLPRPTAALPAGRRWHAGAEKVPRGRSERA